MPTNRGSNIKIKEMNRINQLFNDGSTVPTAFVTVGRQRVKQYGNSVYLNNGSEFQIEIFNPTTTKVLAKIELNGVSLGSGIVLRPGERVFLERYLNESRKFLFETYEVDGNNVSVQKAIADNGKVSVKFYCEQINYGITYTGCDQWEYITPSWPIYNPTVAAPGNPTYTTSVYNSSIGTQYLGNQGVKDVEMASFAESYSNPTETGRIEKGSNSNQSFTYDSTIFNQWWSWSSEWKILPLSRKPIVREDLKVYCFVCGKRRRKSEIYCSKCGTKF